MLYKFIYSLLSVYWKIFHPKTLGVRVLIIKGKQILLVEHTYGEGYFLPGGGVKKFETFEDAAKREVFEETGLKTNNLKLFGVFQNTKEGKLDTGVVFITKTLSLETERESWEIKNTEWFNLSKLPENLNPGSKRRIEEFKSNAYPTFGKW